VFSLLFANTLCTYHYLNASFVTLVRGQLPLSRKWKRLGDNGQYTRPENAKYVPHLESFLEEIKTIQAMARLFQAVICKSTNHTST
jgi:hypothetical protein